MITVIAASMFLYSVPFIAAALGELISQKAGVYNIGLEGYMLVGALTSYLVTNSSGSPWLGLLAGILSGMALSLIHALLTITFKADQIISGISIWLIGLGLTTYLFQMLKIKTYVDVFPAINFGFLSNIPFIGGSVFHQNFIVYAVLILTLVVNIILFSTSFGVGIQAVGDNPTAVDMAGKKVDWYRYCSVLICGALSGLAGSYIVLGILGFFSENITAGRGFIALCTVIFAGWNPWKVVGGAFLFSAIESVQRYLQTSNIGVPVELLQLSPYILTIIVLVLTNKNDASPKMLGIPFLKHR
jgi:ABC-type uncharacterized transport system permease subunit